MSDQCVVDRCCIPLPLQAAFRSSNVDGARFEFVKGNSSRTLQPQKCCSTTTPKITLRKRLPCTHEGLPKKPTVCPQAYLDVLLRSRGYSTKRYLTLGTAYCNRPTPLQTSSYNLHLINLIRKNEVDLFEDLMSCGLASNPCNHQGESCAHLASRLGRHDILRILAEKGCCMSIADSLGRTPLHEACWTANRPDFETIEILLNDDVRLLHMMDAKGRVPLNYVCEEHWMAWIDFIESSKETYWPIRNETKLGAQGPPPLVQKPPNSRPLAEPFSRSLTLEMAEMVSSGRILPLEAKSLYPTRDDDASVTLHFEDDNKGDVVLCGVRSVSVSDDPDSGDDTCNSSIASMDLSEEDMTGLLSKLNSFSFAKPESCSSLQFQRSFSFRQVTNSPKRPVMNSPKRQVMHSPKRQHGQC